MAIPFDLYRGALAPQQSLVRRPATGPPVRGGRMGDYLRDLSSSATRSVYSRAANPAAPRPGADPFAALSEQQITQRAQGMIEPQLKAVTEAINRRAGAATKAVQGYTQTFAPALQQLAGIDVAGLETARNATAATNAALYSALQGGGGAAASELSRNLALTGSPNAGEAAQAQQALGTGAANADLAGGSAQLGAIMARLASAQDYQSKQPGIAALYGGQAIRDVNYQAGQEIADETGRITATLPGLVQGLRETELTKASERQRRLERGQDITRTAAERAQDLRLRRQERAQDTALHVRERAQDLARDERRYADQRTAAGRAERRSWLSDLRQLKRDAEISTGNVYEIAPGTRPGYGGIRPVDVDPRRPGIQKRQTLPSLIGDRDAILEANAQVAKEAAAAATLAERKRSSIAREATAVARVEESKRAALAREQAANARLSESQRAAKAREADADADRALSRIRVTQSSEGRKAARQLQREGIAVNRKNLDERIRHNKAMEKKAGAKKTSVFGPPAKRAG